MIEVSSPGRPADSREAAPDPTRFLVLIVMCITASTALKAHQGGISGPTLLLLLLLLLLLPLLLCGPLAMHIRRRCCPKRAGRDSVSTGESQFASRSLSGAGLGWRNRRVGHHRGAGAKIVHQTQNDRDHRFLGPPRWLRGAGAKGAKAFGKPMSLGISCRDRESTEGTNRSSSTNRSTKYSWRSVCSGCSCHSTGHGGGGGGRFRGVKQPLSSLPRAKANSSKCAAIAEEVGSPPTHLQNLASPLHTV